MIKNIYYQMSLLTLNAIWYLFNIERVQFIKPVSYTMALDIRFQTDFCHIYHLDLTWIVSRVYVTFCV